MMEYTRMIETELGRALDNGAIPDELRRSMEYSLLAGG